MKNKNTLKTLFLASVFLTNTAMAAGVAEISNEASDTEITSAKTTLVTPTLTALHDAGEKYYIGEYNEDGEKINEGDEYYVLYPESAYSLEEITGSVEASDFVITKYLKNKDTGELTVVNYNLLINDYSNNYVDISYSWDTNGDNKTLDLDIDYTGFIAVYPNERIDVTNITWEADKTDSLGSYDYQSINWYNATITGSFYALGGNSYGGAIYNYSPIYSEFFSISEGTTYYYSCDSNNIKLIYGGDFIGNHATISGGAIYNSESSSIEEIIANFIGNYVTNYSVFTRGGAIYNSGEIGSITGDFIGNWVSSGGTGYGVYYSPYGGAIYNMGNIGNINGNFIGNYVYSTHYSMGGSIWNTGNIENITGDFIGNYASIPSVDYYSGAYGGAISNSGNISSIVGDFIGNYAIVFSSSYHIYISDGGAIYNEGNISSIVGDFIENYAYASTTGGYSSSSSYSRGGAIYNSGSISYIMGDFIGNYAS